ncbi:MAG: cell division protein FtsK [Proteobacteria bacterium]|nr:cell division protein FtsK [Pseudomonadota bacterium]
MNSRRTQTRTNNTRPKQKNKGQQMYKNTYRNQSGSKKSQNNQDNFISHRLLEFAGLIMFSLSVFLFLALGSYNIKDPSMNNATPSMNINNYVGLVGSYLSDFLLTTFGAIVFVLPVLLLIYSVQYVFHKKPGSLNEKIITLPFFIVAGATLFERFNPIIDFPSVLYPHNGGMLGMFIYSRLSIVLGNIGTIFLCSMVVFICCLSLTNTSTKNLVDLFTWIGKKVFKAVRLVMKKIRWVFRFTRFKIRTILEKKQARNSVVEANKKSFIGNKKNKSKKEAKNQKITIETNLTEIEFEERQESLPLSLEGGYVLPPLNLLENHKSKANELSEDELNQNARMIEDQLKNFGVEVKVTKVCPGPVITTYELEPAVGVKTAQIVNLSDDLARAMSAVSIRIAPIPGKTVIGVELPNSSKKMITLKQMLSTKEFEQHKGKLTVSLGVNTVGEPAYLDIAKTPHCMIAGTTGSGKSVGVNAMILSLLYRMTPSQLRFIMIDPKMLELSVYNDIPHMLIPVVTDPGKASEALKWVVKEMESRYRKMSEMGVKSIESFNEKFERLEAVGKVPTVQIQTGFDPTTGKPTTEDKPIAKETLPYIVVIIDELADLMLVAGKEVEGSIARIAQMARAAGIHLVIATQRPSVDVITGLIKSNIPTRISFKVASKIDARTILDQMGSEKLLGQGDMLLMANGAPNLKRIHGAFASEEECLEVAKFLKQQAEPNYVKSILGGGSETAAGASVGGDTSHHSDPFFQKAIELVAREQKASTSFLQRSLRIGYNKAATLMDQLESDGVVGPASATGKREIIIKVPPESGY